GALNHHAITPNYHFNETGQVTVGGYTIRDWDLKAHGWISMNYVLEDSLNVGAVKVLHMEGAQPFYQNLQAFGIGHPTGIDLAGEAWSPLPPLAGMSPVQLATASFGQGIVATPIEMLSAINAVANGGVWVQPHVVTSISGGGKPTVYFQPKTHRVISAQAAHTLTQMMVKVVDAPIGSGFEARMWPAWQGQIAGKTGTSSVATAHGVYGNNTYDSFAGFFPASHPQYVILTIIRKPQVVAWMREGAFDAAPTFKQVAQVIIDQKRLRP
ncbi:MAG TPA: penicillin-binding transpeptidase domain-containing protein, partial [Candidatus Dormibacteraeota bacterium]|nr:penicillin-binding transpeptidase domain-containing protein [Candidatus Dormibacteraeota bacterium]